MVEDRMPALSCTAGVGADVLSVMHTLGCWDQGVPVWLHDQQPAGVYPMLAAALRPVVYRPLCPNDQELLCGGCSARMWKLVERLRGSASAVGSWDTWYTNMLDVRMAVAAAEQAVAHISHQPLRALAVKTLGYAEEWVRTYPSPKDNHIGPLWPAPPRGYAVASGVMMRSMRLRRISTEGLDQCSQDAVRAVRLTLTLGAAQSAVESATRACDAEGWPLAVAERLCDAFAAEADWDGQEITAKELAHLCKQHGMGAG